MNDETTRVLVGEETTNLVPYMNRPPALRRAEAEAPAPVYRPAVAAVPYETRTPAPPIVVARAGRGRHRSTEGVWSVWHYVLTIALLTFAGSLVWAVMA